MGEKMLSALTDITDYIFLYLIFFGLFGFLIVLTEGSAVAPFIYALF